MCVFWSWFTQEPKRVFIKTLNHKKFSQIKGNQARKLGLLINYLTPNKLGGSLWMKRVKRSAYGKKGVAWMQGKYSLH
ncbi:hypothetical protein HanHA300_Chr05g0164541 [Helianthus annuus]|nr:hypothetical protein HanHA300_Chr05g0164541 [Helianthus annuus]KAJ0583603.1 hypothetical protein HanHA89_Chr05g0178571 [Helianthus annuus]